MQEDGERQADRQTDRQTKRDRENETERERDRLFHEHCLHVSLKIVYLAY